MTARLLEVLDRTEDVEVQSPPQAARLGIAVAAEVDRQNSQAGLRKTRCLLVPTLFVEYGSVGQNDPMRTPALEVGVDFAAVARVEGDFAEGDAGR